MAAGRVRRAVLALAVAAVVALGVATALTAWGWQRLHRPYGAPPGQEVSVVVAPGSSVRAILGQLEAAGVLEDTLLPELYLHWEGAPPLQAGEYRFRLPVAATEVLERLAAGDVVLHPVTVVEGLTLEETARHLAAQGFGELDAFLGAMARPQLVADLDPAARDLEGYLFPDSYRFSSGAGEEEIVATMVDTFRRRWEDRVAPLVRDPPDRPVRQVVTLASIVEKEAQIAAERPVIAGVYANRLRRGIALYADPTVIYALKREGSWDGNLRKADLALDSPYNTYRHPGLPPGPICSPGLASLQAAADPADVPYLYFVSRNDGTHVFASTLREHNRNVARWQKRYWQESRRR